MEPEVFRRWRIFVSYSHEDGKWIKPLRAHLSGLGPWIDEDSIEPGDPWNRKIEQGLEDARVAVLLISASFLASPYVREKELPYLLAEAEKGRVTLLPIYVLPCDVPPELEAYQAVNKPSQTLADMIEADQNRVFMEAGKKSKAVLSEHSDLVLVTVAKEDRAAAAAVLEGLGKRGLRFDFEEYDDVDDERLRQRVAAKLASRRAALFFVGSRGLGLWDVEIMRETLRRQHELTMGRSAPHRPFVPALLKSSPESLEIPAFLPANTHVRFPDELDDEASLERLRQALEGHFEAARPARPCSPEFNLERLVERLRSENLTLFLGNDLSEEGSDPSEIARALLEDLDLLCPDCHRLVLPVDVAGSYFALSNGERSLEFKLCDITSRHSEPSPTHRRIAKLFRSLAESERSRRSARHGPRHARLIVTTNVDLLMERALLEEGVPFVRLVQDKSGEKIVVNEYRSVETDGKRIVVGTGDSARTVQHDDIEELCNLITDFGRQKLVYHNGNGRPGALESSQNPLRTLPLERFEPRVILYKFHGSEDVRNSCVISTDQHFRLLKAILEKNVIPLKVMEYLASGPVLLFGYSLLDPPFRVLFHTLPLKAVTDLDDEDRRLLLRLPPNENDRDDFRRLEKRLWDKVKELADRCGMAVIEERGDRFLESLTAALDRRRGGGR